MDRDDAMEKEYGKSSGGNYFTYVDTAKLERLGITQYKPQKGDNLIRIVFPPKREGFFGKEIFKHGNVGVNRKTFLCKKRMAEEPCKICGYADDLRKDDPQDKRAAALFASRRYLFFVVDVSSETEMAKGVRWFDCPIKLFNEIRSRTKNKRRGGDSEGSTHQKYVDVSDPKEGRDIAFEQTKEGKKYDYVGVELVPSEPCPEEWYVDIPKFDEILKVSTNEEILEALSGETEPENEPQNNSDLGEKEVIEHESDKEEKKEEEAEKVEEQQKEEGAPTRSVGRRSAGDSSESNSQSIKDKVRQRLENAKKTHSDN